MKEGVDLSVKPGKVDEARRLATAISEGRRPIHHSSPHYETAGPNARPHFHPVDAAGGKLGQHIFYGLAGIASSLTLSNYAEGQGLGLQVAAGIGDLFNPLSVPDDLLSIAADLDSGAEWLGGTIGTAAAPLIRMQYGEPQRRTSGRWQDDSHYFWIMPKDPEGTVTVTTSFN